ncbi:gliding motility-associated C-terminal domain-containing protein [Epilithonimonas sp. JDS]|uniref:T9SS type B sorting domain-containing protein n=1 Tax=Epilithonimonas sp. JDS TaxID=2902797 RepID=UPI001E48BB34|nr:T9SS type B sorting domain-containing protein [Epilithonimonas sp. JDS]MCD9856330.1 gliding motility-associated C-terminal domain-containing protein [Epilithonimonas sp. JDS]
MKKSFLFILIFISSLFFAQMDVEHWFAPIFDSSANTELDSDSGDYLYLSTDKTTPFEVIIYYQNVEINRVNISFGSPVLVKIDDGFVTTKNSGDLFSANKKGLHLVGANKFFANLRILRKNHAEIINSKGLAALGETFYAGMARLSDAKSYYNYQTSIIATQNNTKVDISGYDPGLRFSDGNTYPSGISVTLQKGDSYIISAPYSLTSPNGLIGMKIQATGGPISVTNGNFTGTYIAGTTSTDILMDQSVPTNRLGADYIVAKGNGVVTPVTPSTPSDYLNDMERVLVVATNPNNPTVIYVNGAIYTTLNAGESDFLYTDSYKDLDGSGNYSMSIKAVGGEIYVYQLLSGLPTSKATGGMNLIPSLNCFLPNNIVELPAINEIGPRNNFTTKVNILSQKGAVVLLNGDQLVGHPVPDNTDWELFVKDNVAGNVSIISDKAATAGIASGNANVGYGGYFAGFSSIPAISKVGDCARGQHLEVNDGYDFYEWRHNGVLLDSGAKLSSIDPRSYYPSNPTDAEGIYVCTISKIGCGSKTTTSFTYLNCPNLTTKSLPIIGNCKSTDPILIEFTADPSKKVNFSSISITQYPAEGTVSTPYIDPVTNKIYIKYNADNTLLPQVTFKYYFEDTDVFPDPEEVTVTVNIAQINLKNPKISIISCLQNQMGSYDLKKQFEPINNDPSISRYEYYEDSNYGKRIPDSQLNNYPYYTSKPGDSVYVKIYNTFDCFKTGEISLETFELPVINTVDISDNTSVTINVTKGKAPYLYYIKKDGPLDYLPQLSDYSTSNVLPVKDGKGTYTVYVKSADGCNPVTQIFAVIGIPNVITPNGDGKNDVIDMSMLNYKLNPKFQIFNRNSVKLFDGNVSNNFIWDGKQNGRQLPTGTYWYILQWQDFEGAEPDLMNGWILLKNRN